MSDRLPVNKLEHLYTNVPVVALGISHGLAIVANHGIDSLQATSRSNYGGNQSLYAWGKVKYNALGLGVSVASAARPKCVDFFNGRKVAQVACGDYHSCVLVVASGAKAYNGGTVFSFGLGTGGRLGYTKENSSKPDNSTSSSSWCSTGPNPVGTSIGLVHKVMHVACGANHTLATTIHGYMYSWGLGDFGVLGTGNTNSAHEPQLVQFPQGTDIVMGACGSRHSLALDLRGNCWAWGYGGNGRLGLGNTQTRLLPVLVPFFDKYELVNMSAGDSHVACIDQFGNLYTFGSHALGKLGLGPLNRDVLEPRLVEALSGIDIVEVACGSATTLALDSNGHVYQWGCNLGLNQEQILWSPKNMDIGSPIVHVAAGPLSCALVNIFGDLLTWGTGSNFRLGHGTLEDESLPRFVAELRNRLVITSRPKVAGAAATATSTAENDDNLQLVESLAAESRAKMVSVGVAHAALLSCASSVYTWGANRGCGAFDAGQQLEALLEPVLLRCFATKVRMLACGSAHTLVVTVAGLVFGWGSNECGQLGLGDVRLRLFPEQAFAIENAISVHCGYNNSAVITSTKETFLHDEVGFLWVFGSASGGKLGLGADCCSNVLTPRRCADISGVYRVVLGSGHSLALLQDGSVYACGAATHCGCGSANASTIWNWTPVAPGRLYAIDVAVGQAHSLAVSMDHQLYGWGATKWLGCDASKDAVATEPRLLTAVSVPVAKVSASANHSLIVTQNGELWAWGDSRNGQLGVFTKSSLVEFVPTPSLVQVQEPVIQVDTSRNFTACVTRSGDVYTFGVASEGRLGIGPVVNKVVYEPTRICTSAMVQAPLDEPCNNLSLNTWTSYKTALVGYLYEARCMDYNVADWNTLVEIVLAQDRVCQRSSLESFERDLVQALEKHAQNIIKMHSIYTELDALTFRLFSAIRVSLGKRLTKPQAVANAASPLVASQLKRLCEYLFLQPSYFCRLMLHTRGNYKIVTNILVALYQRIELERVHFQFIASMLTIAREEIQCLDVQAAQVPRESATALIVRAYATLPQVMALNAHLFYGKALVELMENAPDLYLPDANPQGNDKSKGVDDSKLSVTLGHVAKITQAIAQIIMQFQLPTSLEIVFTRIHEALSRKMLKESCNAQVDVKYMHYMPMVPMFIFAIIQPWLEGALEYPEVLGYQQLSPRLVAQYTCISKVYQGLSDPSAAFIFSAKSQQMSRAIYKSTIQAVLTRLASIVVGNAHLVHDVNVTMTTLTSHYDPEPLQVQVPVADLFEFCNLCHKCENVLYMSAHDPLVVLIPKLGPLPLDKQTIDKARQQQMCFTTRICHAFLTKHRNIAYCEYSRIPVPQRLAYRQHPSHLGLTAIVTMPQYKRDSSAIVLEALEALVACGSYGSSSSSSSSTTTTGGTSVGVVSNSAGGNVGAASGVNSEASVATTLPALAPGPRDLNTLAQFFKHSAVYYSNINPPNFSLASIVQEAHELLENKLTSTKVNAASSGNFKGVTTIAKGVLDARQLAIAVASRLLARRLHYEYLLQVNLRKSELAIASANFTSWAAAKKRLLNSCIKLQCDATLTEAPIIKAAKRLHVHLYKHAIHQRPSAKIATFSCNKLVAKQLLIPARSGLVEGYSLHFDVDKRGNVLALVTLRHVKQRHSIQVAATPITSTQLDELLVALPDSSEPLFITDDFPQGMCSINTRFLLSRLLDLVKFDKDAKG